MYNEQILAKALSDIAKKGKDSKYKICTTQGRISQGYIYILHVGASMYIVPNTLRLSVRDSKVIFEASAVTRLINDIKDVAEIRPNGCTINNLTEFTDSDGNKTYVKTKLLKNLDKYEYYYTRSNNNYICVYDSPAKNFLYAIFIETRPKYPEISERANQG